MKKTILTILFFSLLGSVVLFAQRQKDAPQKEEKPTSVFSGLKLRSVGPAFASGRIADQADREHPRQNRRQDRRRSCWLETVLGPNVPTAPIASRSESTIRDPGRSQPRTANSAGIQDPK